MWEQPPASPSPMAAHLSPVNGLLQQAHHVFSLAARCLETFCPLQKNSLLQKKTPSECLSIPGGKHSQVPARRGGVTSSRLFCWQGKEKVNPSGSDTPFIPMYSRKSAMQWTMWSKSWTSKAKGRSYHHSQRLAGSQPGQTVGDFDPFPGQLECSNHFQDFKWNRTWLSCTVGGERPQKAPFHPLPHPQCGQIPALSPSCRAQEGWGPAGT